MGFDYIIGSVHYIKAGEEYIPIDESKEILINAVNKHFGGDIYSLCEEYFRLVANVVGKTDADIIGHFDLISKFNEDGSLFDENHPRYVKAYQDAIKYNDDVLIEEYLVGICATVGILEGENGLFATEILELRPKNEWYDYEAKYTKGMTEFILPAELSDEMTKQVKEIAIKAFDIAGCKGVSRVDFLIVNNIPYVLEINTSPGMTETSDLPAQANAMGINYDNLVQIILNGAGLNK